MPFIIVRQDITKMKVDAIVNAANTELQMGGGVCGAIFHAAGATELRAICNKLAPIKTGDAVITPGFNLPAKFVIHAAGPVYQERNKEQSEQQLRAAYTNSLKVAIQNKCESIAFPLISSGIYGYPKDEALKVAASAIQAFLADHDVTVYLVVFDKAAFEVGEKLLGEVQSYIDEHYVDERQFRLRKLLPMERNILEEEALFNEERFFPRGVCASKDIGDAIENLDEPFSSTLLRLIDRAGKTDAEVYKAANIDRRLFSKIRSNEHYAPSKPTVLALAIALQLNLDKTEDLLERAGFALSHSKKFDVIIEYFITSAKYDIFEINEVLFKYNQPLLGG